MVGLVEKLSWDSECFGFVVARWVGSEDPSEITAAIPRLRAAGVRLVYIFTPYESVASSAGTEKISETGARRVDRKIIYGRELGPAPPSRALARSFPLAPPSAVLRELALASGAHSRFRVDPQMPAHCFQALYDAWILRSTMREIADEVLVSQSEGQVQGMVTIRRDGSVARIGLIAVTAAARGQGIGRGLVQQAESWAFLQGSMKMEVVTQGANLEACKLYERCGYRVERAEDVYHLWIPPEAP